MNKLETALVSFLAEDCSNMPGEKNSEREKGFFTCAGSMFAILENEGLTDISGQEFIKLLDQSTNLCNDASKRPLPTKEKSDA